ncbi:MAG: N-acetylmuramoyl-L-alanine amidase [Turicibacter sp.]|nr:N-acetylmuramoyl-L-alanine amidase [Turicibacter sp.]
MGRKITEKPIICIDAGHGGADPGAVANGLRESNINLDVALKLGAILEQKGCEVLYTRRLDVAMGINARAEYANSHNADFFISIHTNAGGGTGAETFVQPNDIVSHEFATAVNDTYTTKIGLRNRSVKFDTSTRHGSLGVLRGTRMPAILLELGFIDSPAANPDLGILRSKRQEMAAALADGVVAFLGIDTPSVGADSIRPNGSELVNISDKLQIDILGRIETVGGFIENGATFVRLTDFAAALGYEVSWDEVRRLPVVISKTENPTGANLTPVHNLTTDEIRLLETVVHWESRGEDLKGQTLVANVVLNRMRNNNACLADIVYQQGAFTVVERADFYDAEPSELTKSAVYNVLNGVDYSQGATFFHAISHLTPDVWHERAVRERRLEILFDHGNHRFYKGV